MGSIAYDFLADSILFDQKAISTNFSDLSDKQLENILEDYRQHCIKNYNAMIDDIKLSKSALKVFSEIDKIPFNSLKQGALYFDQYIIYDPLFKLTNKKSKTTNTFAEFLGMEPMEKIDRAELAEIASHLKMITPMIAGNFVKIIPLSYQLEPPKEVPINFPVNYYADVLPKELMKYCRERVIVSSMQKADKGWTILDKLDYTAGLFIKFRGLSENSGFIYHYMYQEILKQIGDEVYFSMKIADYPVNKLEWDAWVFQSINSASKGAVDKINLELLVTNDLGSTYLTNKDFNAGLITKNIKSNETIETVSASQFLNLNLPFIENIDVRRLMEIRENEADTFSNFRLELERQCKEIRLVTDPTEFKLRQENLIHDLGKVQINKIDQKLESLKRKGLIDASIVLVGLAGTVQSGGWSLLSAAYATLSGYKSYKDYKDGIKENPAYFLWKVLKK